MALSNVGASSFFSFFFSFFFVSRLYHIVKRCCKEDHASGDISNCIEFHCDDDFCNVDAGSTLE